MTSKTAKSTHPAKGPRLVVFVVYRNIVLLDLVGPLQVFSHAPDPTTGQNGYECAVVSVDGTLTDTNTVVSIPSLAAAQVRDRAIHTLVVVGGDGAIPGMHDAKLVDTVSMLARRAQRVCSVCSGALVLAATGLLDGRRAVTHWDDCAMLADAFPDVRVEMDPIYVKDGHIWTSAGITAGIDMALAIVAEDLGRASALTVGRSMVAQMVRSGGQSQFSPVLGRQLRDGAGQFEALHDWMTDNLHVPLTVDVLAARANMSARNFARVYAQVMGVTPAKAVEAMRIAQAQDLLEITHHSIKQIATTCGFHDEERMRRAFLRTTHVSPSDYRQNFQVP
ncbi:GlxA family transcriptional regulator [Tateyamaria sp. SN3-11]|uniref:GlxA family transcriptional regulator n=1 Tax=Tateyamaria sp. SN3-11 TaxID=3092147 RepID=UPI0039EC8CE9